MALLKLEGRTFGELTAVRAEGVGPKRKWVCVCSCGNETKVAVNKLRAGHTKSCGHLKRQSGPKTHGDTYSREYKIWTFMIQRCTNPNRASYHRYGGRGISVCERWRNDYAAFLEDMGRAPAPDAQIDRINNDGNYEPGNCRWVSQAENSRKRCNTRYIEHDGRRMSMADWADELGVRARLLSARLGRGWTDSETIVGKRLTGEKR